MKKIYFVSGVSGVGKSSTLKNLKELLDGNKFDIRDLDERGVPDGGGRDWLTNETKYWLEVGKENALHGKNTVICGFANPELLEEIYKEDTYIALQIILLDASAETLRSRLSGRHSTPETIKEIERASGASLGQHIESNVSFMPELRSIFQKRKLPIVNTDNKTPEEVTKEVVRIIIEGE